MNLTNHLVFEFSRKDTKPQKIKPIKIGQLSVFARLSKHILPEMILYLTLMICDILLLFVGTYYTQGFSRTDELNPCYLA